VRTKITIATRASALALVQANLVKGLLENRWPGLQVDLLKLTTQGDQILDRPLRMVGGKGLFVKEIEEALLDGRADLAVHSMKDMPGELPEGLALPVCLEREDARDALVSERYSSLEALPPKAKLGTTSLRRKLQVLALRPELEVLDLRGNVDTRLKKLKSGEYDAIILACAGLKRLGLTENIRQALPFIGAPGQGAIGIECRTADSEILPLLEPLNHEPTRICVQAERVVLRRLEGGCELPLGAWARLENAKLHLKAFVADPSGKKYLEDEVAGDPILAEDLGEKLSQILLDQGAAAILKSVRKP